ncbi:MAG: trypsin-like peptidase domain-containing protein [Myxococcota bacterium]|nr:trypsin-like peptidase domain-containing protein [Myxococcota bacterium]
MSNRAFKTVFLGGLSGALAALTVLWFSNTFMAVELDRDDFLVRVFSDAAPSVVSVKAIQVERAYLNLNVNAIERGSGTGFFWDKSGHIVTNLHVIVDADAIQVTTNDQSTYVAQLVGAAPSMDLAVLRIKPASDKAQPIQLGQSLGLQVGQQVLAIGNPFGLDQSLTTGVVSALGRSIESLVGTEIADVIQTDAAINPGNSGGPLLDIRGRLIGINTAIRSPSGASAGVGFAVPVNTIKRAIPDLIAYGRIRRPTLGLRLAPRHIANRLRLEGVLVWTVNRGGPADKAGIQPTGYDRLGRLKFGDLIVQVDDVRIRTEEELIATLEKYRPGDVLQIRLLNGSRTRTVAIKLSSLK